MTRGWFLTIFAQCAAFGHPNQMKMTSFLSTAVAALSLMVFAGSLQITRADEVDDAVKGIRAAYNAIEAAKLREETVEFESDDDPVSGSCTRYFKGDELVKIRINYSQGDHGGADESYYYTDGELFFCLCCREFVGVYGRGECGWGRRDDGHDPRAPGLFCERIAAPPFGEGGEREG